MCGPGYTPVLQETSQSSITGEKNQEAIENLENTEKNKDENKHLEPDSGGACL